MVAPSQQSPRLVMMVGWALSNSGPKGEVANLVDFALHETAL
jgi:hypothetical protein